MTSSYWMELTMVYTQSLFNFDSRFKPQPFYFVCLFIFSLSACLLFLLRLTHLSPSFFLNFLILCLLNFFLILNLDFLYTMVLSHKNCPLVLQNLLMLSYAILGTDLKNNCEFFLIQIFIYTFYASMNRVII